MSRIDFITAVLAVPLADPDAGPDSALLAGDALAAFFESLDRQVAALCERPDGGQSRMDALLSTLLEQPVSADGVLFTSYEKKGVVYPAIVIEAAGLRDAQGGPLTDELAERLAAPAARTRLAELLGTELGVAWVSTFATFGPSGR